MLVQLFSVKDVIPLEFDRRRISRWFHRLGDRVHSISNSSQLVRQLIFLQQRLHDFGGVAAEFWMLETRSNENGREGGENVEDGGDGEIDVGQIRGSLSQNRLVKSRQTPDQSSPIAQPLSLFLFRHPMESRSTHSTSPITTTHPPFPFLFSAL